MSLVTFRDFIVLFIINTNHPADTKTSYQRRSNVEFRRRNEVAFVETWCCSNVSSWRRDNVVSTSEQPQTTSIKGCLNVVMQRWNDVVFWRCINISITKFFVLVIEVTRTFDLSWNLKIIIRILLAHHSNWYQ